MFAPQISMTTGLLRFFVNTVKAVGRSSASTQRRPDQARGSEVTTPAIPRDSEDPALSAPSSSGWAM